jgi:hypothetical protein
MVWGIGNQKEIVEYNFRHDVVRECRVELERIDAPFNQS